MIRKSFTLNGIHRRHLYLTRDNYYNFNHKYFSFTTQKINLDGSEFFKQSQQQNEQIQEKKENIEQFKPSSGSLPSKIMTALNELNIKTESQSHSVNYNRIFVGNFMKNFCFCFFVFFFCYRQ